MAELVANELARRGPRGALRRAGDLERALLEVLPALEGAFSFVLMDEGHVVGVRDPTASGRCASVAGATGRLGAGLGDARARRRSAPTSSVSSSPARWSSSTPRGYRSVRPFPAEQVDPKLCLFEFVYFARPDTDLYGQSVHRARVRMGEQLAEQAPVDADLVMGVPESGMPAAEGYARRSGIPYGQGLVKNRYIGRTFIAPNQESGPSACA